MHTNDNENKDDSTISSTLWQTRFFLFPKIFSYKDWGKSTESYWGKSTES
jgi:hypothetical protein